MEKKFKIVLTVCLISLSPVSASSTKFAECALALPSGSLTTPHKEISVYDLLQNDEQAWKEISRHINAVLIHKGFRGDQEQDLRQEIILALIQRLDRNPNILHVKGFVTGIAMHMANRIYREKKTLEKLQDQWPSNTESVLKFIIRMQKEDLGQRALQYALDFLTIKENDVFVLMILGISNSNIKRQLNLTDNQLRNFLSRATKKIIRYAKVYVHREKLKFGKETQSA